MANFVVIADTTIRHNGKNYKKDDILIVDNARSMVSKVNSGLVMPYSEYVKQIEAEAQSKLEKAAAEAQRAEEMLKAEQERLKAELEQKKADLSAKAVDAGIEKAPSKKAASNKPAAEKE